MNAETRREELKKILLQSSGAPISATALASKFSVSRQVIVGDIALLRAGGEEIEATPRGYVMKRKPSGVVTALACVHNAADTEAELNIMVDNGCRVIDVIVEHQVYGQLTGQLDLSSRYDVSRFIKSTEEGGVQLLSSLTGGVHLHTLQCPDVETVERVKAALESAGFLYK
ncbi:MAG: transcription repressor NadR [Ruminococcaceae bacterium]|nr:transcription repressor NadR [Oscillospiraceae bacterium]